MLLTLTLLASCNAISEVAQKAPEKVVIAVMGPTGSGKSSFIKAITGNEAIEIGHELTSGTAEVATYDFRHEGQDFSLVDTPGFDDSYGNDAEIVNAIVKWLGEGNKLTGILYFHRIIDPKITGTARANLRMFKRLCGDDNLRNVLLVTTFWNEVDQSLGERREMQLRTDPNFWKPMVDQGSRVVRSEQHLEKDLRVLLEIAQQNQNFYTQAQKDMRHGKSQAEVSTNCFVASLSEQAQREREVHELRLRVEREKLEAFQKEKAAERQAAIVREKVEQRQRQEEIERQQRLEREREEEQRRSAETAARRRKEAEAKEMRVMSEAIERQEQLVREEKERQERYAAHVCRMIPLKRRDCSRCQNRMDWVGDGAWCYHCCHCDGDQYHLCQGCVATCKDPEHPVMKIRHLPQTTLTSVARLLLE